jgi:N-acetylglucosaminyl-diphospho-decaprenol L-rhamnosyltransferase
MTSAIAVINWNSGPLLHTCIDSLLATTKGAEILVVDNASSDNSLEPVAHFRDRVGFIRNSVNRGFAAAVNQAFQSTSSTCVLILNPDVQVSPGAIQLLEEFMDAQPRAGAVGGYAGDKYLPRAFPTVGSLVRENLGLGFQTAAVPDKRQFGGRTLRSEAQAISVDQPAAAAIMIRRDAYDEAGGFDERFFPAWYEDVDFCRRIKAQGWEIFFLRAAEFVHSGGYSADALGSEAFLRTYYGNQLKYVEKHFGSLSEALVRTSIAAGMIGRMLARPREAKAYGKAAFGALKGW